MVSVTVVVEEVSLRILPAAATMEVGAPFAPEHPEADKDHEEATGDLEPAVKVFLHENWPEGVTHDGECIDAQGVGEGDGDREGDSLSHGAPTVEKVGGEHRLGVARLKAVEQPEDERGGKGNAGVLHETPHTLPAIKPLQPIDQKPAAVFLINSFNSRPISGRFRPKAMFVLRKSSLLPMS